MTQPTRFADLRQHLLDCAGEGTSVSLDTGLIDDLRRQLNQDTDRQVLKDIVCLIIQSLPQITQREEPRALVGLVETIAPLLSVRDLGELVVQEQKIWPDVVSEGLASENTSVNLMALSLLQRAAESYEDADSICTHSAPIAPLVSQALSVESLEVAQKAMSVLQQLLKAHTQPSPDPGVPPVFGEVWDRVFEVERYYPKWIPDAEACDAMRRSREGRFSARQYSVAKARLWDLTLCMASLHWESVTTSHLPDDESRSTWKSLLDWVVCRMVDYSDELLLATHLASLSRLISLQAPGISGPTRSPALDFLIERGVHDQLVDAYLGKQSCNEHLLSPLCKHELTSYVETYVSCYPRHLLEQPSAHLSELRDYIARGIDVSPARWANSPEQSNELRVMVALPRTLLLRWRHLVQLIPAKPLTEHALLALSQILSGPACSRESDESIAVTPEWRAEAAAARELCAEYMTSHTSLWAGLAKAMETVAYGRLAIAACDFASSLLEARWTCLQVARAEADTRTDKPDYIDSHRQTGHRCDAETGESIPKTGLELLTSPQVVQQFLLPILESHHSRRTMPPEDKLLREATVRKITFLKSLRGAILANPGQEDPVTSALLVKLELRIIQGPLGGDSQRGGPDVATLST
ncbi:hypothetical protein KEM52_002830 [Ascosphaera acerosa]|nr:hypothetical protein KEM52_002830 [Ascosphaera acerosa]